MSLGVLTIMGFLAGALAVGGAYSLLSDLYLRDRTLNRRVNEEFRKNQRDNIQRSSLFKNLGQLAAEAESEEAAEKSLRQRFCKMVDQSGLNLPPDRLLVYMAVVGSTLGGLVGLVQGQLLAVLVAGTVGALVPFFVVLTKRNARLHKLLGQLPDAFDLMARIIRAGQTMAQAIQSVGEEFDQPISGEFAYCYEQQNLGLSPEVALRDLANRTGLLEIKIFALALLVQQQSGGNLAELLDKLANIIRERFRIKGKIKAMTAEGRFQALILLLLPPVILVGTAFLNPTYIKSLLLYPHLLIGMVVSEFLGALWIRKIINFDY
jgi:tight adherence protein B